MMMMIFKLKFKIHEIYCVLKKLKIQFESKLIVEKKTHSKYSYTVFIDFLLQTFDLTLQSFESNKKELSKSNDEKWNGRETMIEISKSNRFGTI